MTIDRQHGRLIFCCDNCGETAGETAGESEGVRVARRVSEEPDFQEMWADLKTDGWKAEQKIKGGWAHYCPECAERS